MAKHKLSDAKVRAASKAGKLGDGDGLWLNVTASGTKSWLFIYARQGRRRDMGLGAFGSGTGQVSLSQARIKADEARAIIGTGGDPFTEMAERKAKPIRKSFATVAEEYLATKEGAWRNDKHHDQWVMTLGDAYCAELRKLMVDEITSDDVLAILEPIWMTKHETASRLRGRIERVLDYARVKRLRAGDNPARWKGHLEHSLQRPGKKLSRGHHAALPYAEAQAFMSDLRGATGVGARALEFLVHTAGRTTEVTGARWDEFQLDEAVWTVPAERMKANREHRVPLTPQALAIVRTMQERSLNEFVFPGAKVKRPISNMTMTKVLRAMKRDGITVHGFRSTFRDWAAEETSFPENLAEAALAHIVGDETERAYRRGDVLAKRRKMMTAWSRFLEVNPSSNVLRFMSVK